MGNITIIFGVGPKELATSAHFISSPWPMPRKKKCPRINKESPNRQDIILRTTLSSVDQDHERGRYHATKGSLLECPNGKPKCHGPAVGVWQRSNPRKGRHLHIKYPQLTSWPNWYVDVTPRQCYLGHNSSQNVRRSGWWNVHSSVSKDD